MGDGAPLANAVKDKALGRLRGISLLETRQEHQLAPCKRGSFHEHLPTESKRFKPLVSGLLLPGTGFSDSLLELE